MNHPTADGGWVATHEDVTDEKRAEERITHAAYYDGLTGLPNRKLFSEQLEQIGSSAESVTVTDAAPLLKTESGELAHNVSADTLNNLPVLGIGTASVGATGIRSPYSVMNLIPGASWLADNTMRLNGSEGNSAALRVEGQDATPTVSLGQTSQTQPSVEATQEVAIQTSNYAAEYGQAGGGLFNFTMKSGTNQFHGSAYDYFVNEALNAGTPFTDDGKGHLLRPRQRRNDYGFSLGGPVRASQAIQRPR